MRELLNERIIEWENETMRDILDIGGTERDFPWSGEPPGGDWGNRSELGISTALLRSAVRTL